MFCDCCEFLLDVSFWSDISTLSACDVVVLMFLKIIMKEWLWIIQGGPKTLSLLIFAITLSTVSEFS